MKLAVHERLKISCRIRRAGSSPARSTNPQIVEDYVFFRFVVSFHLFYFPGVDNSHLFATVPELEYELDSKSSAAMRVGSNPTSSIQLRKEFLYDSDRKGVIFMKYPYIVATEVGGVMENPEITYKNKQVIWAETPDEACRLYNDENDCNYYYGKVIGISEEDMFY